MALMTQKVMVYVRFRFGLLNLINDDCGTLKHIELQL